MSEHAVVVREQSLPQAPAENLLSMIANAARDPNVDIEKMERLMAMHERLVTEQRRTAFMAAMARLQATLPQITKQGQGKNSKFAKLEDLDVVVRPLLAAEGFSFSFDEESHTEKSVTFIAILSHREGHSETKRMTVPIDTAATNQQGRSVRPAIQDAGSTVSYARRYLMKMALNIIERDEDVDGENLERISEEQARDIELALQELQMNPTKFKLYMGVGEIADILQRDLKKTEVAFQAQREALAKKAK